MSNEHKVHHRPITLAVCGGLATTPIAVSLPWFAWGNPYTALTLFLCGCVLWATLVVAVRP